MNTNPVVTVRATTSVQSFRTTGGSAKDPLTNRVEFTSKKRIENQGVVLGPSGFVEVTIADESMTRTDLVRIESLTPGRSFVLKFDADPTGVEYGAPATNLRAMFLGTVDANVIRIENPSDALEIEIEFSIFERVI